MKRFEKWSNSSLFSRARSRGLARSLCSLFRGGARWGLVEIRCRAGVCCRYLSPWQLLFRSNVRFVASSWKRNRGHAFPCACARVCTTACDDCESECIGTRTTAQVYAGRTSLRCARHLPARFLR